jgi:hypothetical protein
MNRMFGCGTGVVVVQVGLVRYQDVEYNIPANPSSAPP